MATYREIQSRIKEKHGYVPATCWIAHVKADHGLTRGVSPNRQDLKARVKPCPPAARPQIEAALRHFGML